MLCHDDLFVYGAVWEDEHILGSTPVTTLHDRVNENNCTGVP